MGLALGRPLMAARPAAPDPRRRTHWITLAGVLGSAVLLGAAWWRLSDPRVMPIERVSVEGSFRHVARDLVEQRLEPLARSAFFTVDLDRLAGELRADPWVDRVSIRRVWPGGVAIRIVEQTAYARWSPTEYLNPRGEVFAAAGVGYPDLPLLRGPQGQGPDMIAAQRRFDRVLAPLGRRVAELDQDARRSWRMRLDDGVVVELGREDVEARLQRFVTAFPLARTQDGRRPLRVDMRYTNGFSVAWQDAPAAATTDPLGVGHQ